MHIVSSHLLTSATRNHKIYKPAARPSPIPTGPAPTQTRRLPQPQSGCLFLQQIKRNQTKTEKIRRKQKDKKKKKKGRRKPLPAPAVLPRETQLQLQIKKQIAGTPHIRYHHFCKKYVWLRPRFIISGTYCRPRPARWDCSRVGYEG